MKYAVVTFGCRVNQADSLAVEAALRSQGGESVPASRADVVIVNTCSVTASADQGARQAIRRIARENPGARIIATGCYATRAFGDVAALPGVAAVVPNADKTPAAVLAAVGGARIPAHLGTEGACGRHIGPGLMGRTAWTLRVQTGCDEACSYCIIPTTRGTSRSRPPADVIGELDRVVEAGYREIAITGVHLGSYGRDLAPAASLAGLLETLAARYRCDEPAKRVLFRVSSLEPMDCTPRVLGTIAAGPFAPHLHLPLQHASDRLLTRMARPYTAEFYAGLVSEVERRIPHAAIGTDVIVGFPGETDGDFEELVSYLEQSPITHVHVFPYSDRPGTVASRLGDRVHGITTAARARRIREISRALQARFRASLVGTIRPALTIDDGTVAVTDNYIRVPLPPGQARNEWVEVAL